MFGVESLMPMANSTAKMHVLILDFIEVCGGWDDLPDDWLERLEEVGITREEDE
jgi:hypothetical protein